MQLRSISLTCTLILLSACDSKDWEAAVSAQAEMSKLTGGMELPFKLPF